MFTLQIKTNDNMKNKLMTLAVAITVIFASCDELTSIAETATSAVGGSEEEEKLLLLH